MSHQSSKRKHSNTGPDRYYVCFIPPRDVRRIIAVAQEGISHTRWRPPAQLWMAACEIWADPSQADLLLSVFKSIPLESVGGSIDGAHVLVKGRRPFGLAFGLSDRDELTIRNVQIVDAFQKRHLKAKPNAPRIVAAKFSNRVRCQVDELTRWLARWSTLTSEPFTFPNMVLVEGVSSPNQARHFRTIACRRLLAPPP